MNIEEFNEWLKLKTVPLPRHLRRGQLMVSELYKMFPVIYGQVVGSDAPNVDAFYNDDLIDRMIDFVRERVK